MPFDKYFPGVGEMIRGMRVCHLSLCKRVTQPAWECLFAVPNADALARGPKNIPTDSAWPFLRQNTCLSCLIMYGCVGFFLRSDRKGSLYGCRVYLRACYSGKKKKKKVVANNRCQENKTHSENFTALGELKQCR